MKDLIADLSLSLSGELPGPEIQFQMASAFRYTRIPPPDNAVDAAVLLLLYPDRNSKDWNMVFIERISHNLKDHHRGQISFPGGRYEPTDPDLGYTALREAEEEVGAPAEQITLIGALTSLYVPVSGYMIHPYVGYTERSPDFRAQPSEVGKIIESPLSGVLNKNARKIKDIETPSRLTLRDVPFFEIEGHTIWGATAMILNEFLHLSPLRQP